MTPFENHLLDVLADRAMTGFEIARAVEHSIPGALTGREGVVYPALMSLERQDRVAADWEIREEGRRRVYRVVAPPPVPAEAPEESEFLEGEGDPDGDA